MDNNLFLVFGFVLGAVLGSFAAVLASHSLNGFSFLGRSACQSCHKKLAWFDLIPIFSFLSLKGKCRYCKKEIPKETIIMELVSGVLVAFLFWQSAVNLQPSMYSLFYILEVLFKSFFIVVLLTLALTDLKETLIPDRIIIPSLWIAFSGLVVLTGLKIFYFYKYLLSYPLGRLLLEAKNGYFYRHSGYFIQDLFTNLAVSLAIGGFFYLIIVFTKGRGMGGGDVKLGAFIGLILGFPYGFLALMISFISGALVSLFLILLGKKSFGQTIPFGPFLVFGALASLFFGKEIIDLYLKINLPI